MASLEEIRQTRLEKLKLLESKGINAYPASTERDYYISEAVEQFDTLSSAGKSHYLVGRILSLREQGKIIFLTFFDGTGKFQALLKSGDPLSEEVFKLFQEAFDIGDFIEVKGTLFTTNKGEKTILAEDIKMLSKSLRPLPEKWYGLQDVEERFRKRYLDILSNEEVRGRFEVRSRMVSLIREFYIQEGFMEVDLPNLQPLAGGATAAPFTTHHNALDMDFYLPIAQELYLKELLAGGMNKVFEMGKRFRNEGIDTSHNPEFTMLESNEAYADAESQRDFIQRLFRFVVQGLFGKLQFTYNGYDIDLEPDFKVMKFPEITDEEYKKTIRPSLIHPTFLVDYPVSFNPFAKRKEDNPELIDRFQLVMGGAELVNAFSELNNPVDQKERYLEEDKKGQAGEGEISLSDQEYLEAMEYGMPPNGGIGIGIDRLAMILTDTSNIKEVILFPTLKPKIDESKKPRGLSSAVAVINTGAGLEKWQELNTIAHLCVALGAREGRGLFTKDKVLTKDGSEIMLNIKHGIVTKVADSNKALRKLVEESRGKGLQVSEFTREMIETTNDRKLEEMTSAKSIKDIDFLGVLVFGPKSEVDDLTADLELYK